LHLKAAPATHLNPILFSFILYYNFILDLFSNTSSISTETIPLLLMESVLLRGEYLYLTSNVVIVSNSLDYFNARLIVKSGKMFHALTTLIALFFLEQNIEVNKLFFRTIYFVFVVNLLNTYIVKLVIA
jgi:hypothetical protein